MFGIAVPPSSSTIGVTNSAAAISGYVYNDINQNGSFNAGDTGLSGVTIQLFTTNGMQTLVAVTTTASDGSYQFVNLSINNYKVVKSLPPGYANSSSVTVTTNVTALTTYPNVNFFVYLPSPSTYASISGSVTNDLNWNGVANAGEPGLANVTINLLQDLNSNGLANASEPVIASTLTDTNGNYSFADIPPGRYVIQEVTPYGYYATNVTLGAGSSGFLAATNSSGVLTNFTQIGLVLTNGQKLGRKQLFGRPVFLERHGV